jgi:hypothetical protein
VFRWLGTIIGAVVLSGCQTTEKASGSASARATNANGELRRNFDAIPACRLPDAWERGETHPSAGLAEWAVVADATAPSPPNVLALVKTNNERPTFNLAIAKDCTFKDLDLTVKVKAKTGKIDQGGGPIWRCQDQNNYYVCRINPLENNYRVYRVVNGQRTQLANADVELKANTWYTLGVTMKGEQIACRLDGKEMLQAADGTIPQAGHVGLWTKADAATSFDNLTVIPAVEQ